jgi:hypothetical protein
MVLDETLELLRAHYTRVAPQLMGPVLEFLHVSRRVCGGDVEAFIVLAAIMLRAAEHESFAKLDYEDLKHLKPEQLLAFGTNLRSIADSVGIPRETVRRKARMLLDAGWVVRRGREIYCTPAVFQDLLPVRESLLRLALRNHRTVGALHKRS